MQLSNYTRNCPVCGKELYYKSPISFKFAEDNNQKCKDCCERKNRIAPEIIKRILDMNEQGILNREIGRALSIHHKTVASYLQDNGREQNFANQPIDQISDTEARCRKCGEIKNINEFQFGRKGQKYEYKFSYCNDCRKKQTYLNLNSDITKFLTDRFNRLKRRAKKLNIVCTISKQDFIDQYNNQNGLCFYTDEKLVCEVGSNLHRNSLSVDKIDPDKGYVKDNVVFTTHQINTCKNDLSLYEIQKWMPNWSRKIETHLGTTMKKSEALTKMYGVMATQSLISLGYDPDWTIDISFSNLEEIVKRFYPRLEENLTDPIIGAQSVLDYIRSEIGLQFLDGPLAKELHPTFIYLDPDRGRIKLKLFGAYECIRKWIEVD